MGNKGKVVRLDRRARHLRTPALVELLRRRKNPDERISERNSAIASKFMDGVKSTCS